MIVTGRPFLATSIAEDAGVCSTVVMAIAFIGVVRLK
jgi:hypothetical protein